MSSQLGTFSRRQVVGGLGAGLAVVIQKPANARPRPDDFPDRIVRHPLTHNADHARVNHRRHPTGLKDEEILQPNAPSPHS